MPLTSTSHVTELELLQKHNFTDRFVQLGKVTGCVRRPEATRKTVILEEPVRCRMKHCLCTKMCTVFPESRQHK